MRRILVLLIAVFVLALIGCDTDGACETNGAGGCAIQF